MERQHPVDTHGPRSAGEGLEPHPEDWVGVAEDDNGRCHPGADLGHHGQHPVQGGAGGQRPLGGPLDDRSVGQRIRERDAHFQDIRPGGVQALEDGCRPRQVRVPRGDVGHQTRPVLRAHSREGVIDAGHHRTP